MATFNIEKAKAAGMTDEQINSFLQSRPDLQPKTTTQPELTGNLGQDILSNTPRILNETIHEAAPAVREKSKQILDAMHLPETGNTQSTAANIAIGLPRTLAEIPAELVADNVTPVGLATNAVTLGAGPIVRAVGKGGSQALGSLLSGKKMKTIGKLFDQPEALGAGIVESVTGAAKKAFGAAKDASGIRQVKRGAEALDTAKDAVKEVFTSRKAIADRVKELVKSGADKEKALKYAISETNLPQATLEGRQALDSLPSKVKGTPAFSALRNKLNASLEKIAPAIREADPKVARAALGKEFLKVLPEGFTRRLASTGFMGGAVLNPTSVAGAMAMSPLATGIGTAAAGTASKAVTGLTKSQLRRALISAMASRANDNNEEQK